MSDTLTYGDVAIRAMLFLLWCVAAVCWFTGGPWLATAALTTFGASLLTVALFAETIGRFLSRRIQ